MPSTEEKTHASGECCPGFDELKERAEHFAREEPMQAIGAAFVAGLLLTFLPIGSVVAGIVRLAFALLRPALVLLGAVKLYEEISRRQR
jgi:ABC-type transport system involved in cytochrome bd biosynthesis fused ATPase/permease subunit